MAVQEIPQKTASRLKKVSDQVSKNSPDFRKTLKMMVGAYYLPKQNEDRPLGQDAYFICEEEQTIGLADGVGGWDKYGIDSGVYARELMDNAVDSVKKQLASDVNPMHVLDDAYFNTEAEGAATACIITLKNDSLMAVNVGDSGFLVIRDDKIVYRSPTQQSYFNCPYQLGNTTDYDPSSAQEFCVDVEPGDIVVLATDGLFDNVFPDEIEQMVKLCMDEDYPVEVTAWNLVNTARQAYNITDYISPFTEAAMEDGRDFETYKGGKYDDVTVIVAYIY